MTAKPSGLSRGLDALLTEVTKLSAVEISKTHVNSPQIYGYLPIEQLHPGKYQPRSTLDSQTLQELAASIKAQGIIQPLVVRKTTHESYEIIAGERRWRSAKIAGLVEVPVIIHDVADETAIVFALIENIQREDLNPIDQALALSRLKNEFLITHEKIAEIVGRSRSAVTNLLRLLTLNEEVKQFLQENKLEMGHAKVLLSLNGDQQVAIARHIIERELSVRAAENLIRKIKSPAAPPEKMEPTLIHNTQQWSETLSRKLSSSVRVQLNSKGEGRVVIRVSSPEEVKWLIDHIKGD